MQDNHDQVLICEKKICAENELFPIYPYLVGCMSSYVRAGGLSLESWPDFGVASVVVYAERIPLTYQPWCLESGLEIVHILDTFVVDLQRPRIGEREFCAGNERTGVPTHAGRAIASRLYQVGFL